MAPNAFMNGYNIYNPDSGSPVGQFVMNNFSNPVEFICGAIGAVENTTAPETAKLCSQYLGPALRLLNFNYLPFPIDPYLMPSASPEMIEYSEPRLAPGGGGGAPTPPETPPSISAYNPGPEPPPPFTGRAPGAPPPGAQQLLPGGEFYPPNMPNTVSDMLNPTGGQPGPAPGPARDLRQVRWPPKPRRLRPRHQQKGRHQHDQGEAGATGDRRRILCSADDQRVRLQGVNSLPLPGAVGRGADSSVYHVEIANVATLEPNSPVMMNDVVVGSVRKPFGEGLARRRRVLGQAGCRGAGQRGGQCWTDQPSGLHASGARTHPAGQAPTEKLPPGATIQLNNSSTYPTTEQTAVLAGRGGERRWSRDKWATSSTTSAPRSMAGKLISVICSPGWIRSSGALDAQRDNIVASIQGLNQLASTFAGQRDVITRALEKIPPALDVLIEERPRFTTALQKLGTFSGTANQFVNESQADLVRNLKNLEPALKALANVGRTLIRCSNMHRISRSPRASWTGSSAVITTTCTRTST